MIYVVIFGPPGAGKGTQSDKMIEQYGFAHISTGDVFRYNMKNDTELGKLAKQYIEKGELVPDEVTVNMLQSEIEKLPEAKGIILDGFPRTVPQAEVLDKMLSEKSEKVDVVLQLDVTEQVVRDRIEERAKVSGRTDDQKAEIVERRISEYYGKTIHVLPYYETQGKVTKLDGEASIDGVFAMIEKTLEPLV